MDARESSDAEQPRVPLAAARVREDAEAAPGRGRPRVANPNAFAARWPCCFRVCAASEKAEGFAPNGSRSGPDPAIPASSERAPLRVRSRPWCAHRTACLPPCGRAERRMTECAGAPARRRRPASGALSMSRYRRCAVAQAEVQARRLGVRVVAQDGAVATGARDQCQPWKPFSRPRPIAVRVAAAPPAQIALRNQQSALRSVRSAASDVDPGVEMPGRVEAMGRAQIDFAAQAAEPRTVISFTCTR